MVTKHNNNLTTKTITLAPGLVLNISGNIVVLTAANATLTDRGVTSNTCKPTQTACNAGLSPDKVIRFGMRSDGTIICQNQAGTSLTNELSVFGSVSWVVN